MYLCVILSGGMSRFCKVVRMAGWNCKYCYASVQLTAMFSGTEVHEAAGNKGRCVPITSETGCKLVLLAAALEEAGSQKCQPPA